MNPNGVTPSPDVEVREDHAVTAIEFADEADAYTDRLQRLYGAGRTDSEQIAQVHQRLRTSIKLAEVNALLAIADQVRALREYCEKVDAPVTLLQSIQDGDPHR